MYVYCTTQFRKEGTHNASISSTEAKNKFSHFSIFTVIKNPICETPTILYYRYCMGLDGITVHEYVYLENLKCIA